MYTNKANKIFITEDKSSPTIEEGVRCNMENQSYLEEPLKGTPYRDRGHPDAFKTTQYKGPSEWKKPKTLQGPKRAIRLILLGIILPGLFIAVPLYMK